MAEKISNKREEVIVPEEISKPEILSREEDTSSKKTKDKGGEMAKKEIKVRNTLKKTYSENKELSPTSVRNFVERAAEIVEDVSGLPLSVDPAFVGVEKTFKNNFERFGEVLFAKARSTQGEERIRYATALIKLGYFISKNDYDKMLKGLLTNKETLDELVEQGLRELGHKNPKEELARREKEEISQDVKKTLGPLTVPVMILGALSNGVEFVKNIFRNRR